ncbi:MAG: hypothetical protein NXI04_10920 [Planctomycetaceae bacterium]|nr:hypothetical protein [Planctomycetaceae bacterium]
MSGQQTSEPTAHSSLASDSPSGSDGGWIRRATRVIERHSRSRYYADSELRDRINRALAVMDQTTRSETAFVDDQPVSSTQRLATRIVRQLGFKT